MITLDQLEADPAAKQRHPREIRRVEKNIGTLVLAFCLDHVNDHFTMSELSEYVRSRGEVVAPDSAGRILRMLRATGRVDYAIVNRSQSLYVVHEVYEADDE